MGVLGMRVANLAFFVVSCFLAANVVNQFAGAMLAPTRKKAAEEMAGWFR